MLIDSLSVSRFRSLKAIEEWKPSPLNVLIGPNGSGKSNVLKALELLAVSAEGGLAKLVQKAGGMEPLLWDGEGSELGFRIQGKLLWPILYELSLGRLGNGGDFQVLKEWLGIRNLPDQATFIDRIPGKATFIDGIKSITVTSADDLPSHETVLSLIKTPFSARLMSDYRSKLASIAVYHDLHTHQDSAIRRPAITRFEKRVTPDGQNLISVLHTLYTGDRDFKNEVNAAMRAAFGPDFDELVFPPAADQRIQLRVRWHSLRREQSAADLSDGTLRFLFLLAVLASPDPAPLIAIDEPESGLHPSMLPIIAEYAVEASKRTQIIFTTHSPQFLDAFTTTKPQITVVKWVDGETRLTVPDEARLNEWLREYTLGDLSRSGELEDMA